jgi:hypothetical protein
MSLIKNPASIDLGLFSANDDDVQVKYGLPRYVHFCKQCVISNQRPNSAVEYEHTKASKKATIAFDEEGVCDACRFAEQKHGTINWKDREDQLAVLCDKFRSTSGYDCLLPGSGGKDSFYASHVLKTRFNMHPLTVTWAPHIYTDWGRKNFDSWLHAGFDNYLMTPNGRVHRLLTRLAVDNLFHPFQAFMFGQKSLAPNTAKRDWSYFTSSDKSKIHLSGTPINSLYNDFGLEEHDLLPYLPADPVQIEKKQIEVHYLGYYLKWHPQSCYYYAVEHGGFEASPERTPGTYSKYNSIDDRIDDFHYYTTFVKFGIGRATYDAAQEIRSRDINRDEGVALVRRYDGEFPERFVDEIFRYLSIPAKEFPVAHKMFESPVMDRDYFMRLADSFRSPHLWKREADQFKLRHSVFDAA